MNKTVSYEGVYRVKQDKLIRRTDGLTLVLGDRGSICGSSRYFLTEGNKKYIGNFYDKNRFMDGGIAYEAVWESDKCVAIVLFNREQTEKDNDA